MAEWITQRELRNENGKIMRALDRGTPLSSPATVSRSGSCCRRAGGRFVAADAVLAAFAGAPGIDAAQMRDEIDGVLDQTPEPRA